MGADPSSAVLAPITSETLDEVAHFLNQHMRASVTVEQWLCVLRAQWLEDAPNHGFLLRSEDGRIVGVLCAIYAPIEIAGTLERFCNPHTWCVIDAYRKRSMELVIALIKQPGYHFTMLSPNAEGEQIFAFLKFKPADRATWVIPCALRSVWVGRSRVLDDPQQIDERLAAAAAVDERARAALRVLRDHRAFDWLSVALLSHANRHCLMLYRRTKWKRLPAATVLYLSDPEVFAKAGGALLTSLQLRRGLCTVHIEQRLLGTWRPPLSLSGPLAHPKFLRSPTLDPALTPNIYSELVALRL